MSQENDQSAACLARLWPCFLFLFVWLWMFWPMMSGQTVVGFRDSAYLYYPLFRWIDAQWAANEIPLWNPYCNLGMPVVADGTSSVFYPGKLIFFCRFLTYPSRYGIYLAIHIPIAGLGAYWFARKLRANQAGATLAAFSYAFGGSFLFQVTNVVYLVSAAWLPFALCCVLRFVSTGNFRWSVAAAVFCALMILGGDPQMVYHVGLVAIATMLAEFRRRRRRQIRSNSQIKQSSYRWLIFESVPGFILLVCVTGLLAAIQLLPTYVWSRQSERTNPTVPANIYQVMTDPETFGHYGGFRELLAEPTGTIDHSYQFSQAPWSLTELFWPNVSGKPYPRHQRWTNSLAGADRIWVPSLYLGLVTVLVAMTGFRFFGRSRKKVWLTWLITFFAVGSFGWYGIVWLIHEFSPPNSQLKLGSQVGGLYWLMNIALPNYFAFRYPAKLFVVASLGLSLLAGVSLRKSRMGQVAVVASLFSLISVAGLVALFIFVDKLFVEMSPDIFFGPFDSVGAINSLKITLIHTIAVGLVFATLGFLIVKARQGKTCQILFGLLILVATVEIVFANCWLIPQVPTAVFESPTKVQARLSEFQNLVQGPAPLRLYRSPNEIFEPPEWYRASSDSRLAEIITWQRETLHPKHHLGQGISLLGSFASISPACDRRYMEEFESTLRQKNFGGGAGIPFLPKMYQTTVEVDKQSGAMEFIEFEPSQFYDLTNPVEWMFEYDPKFESEKANRYPRSLWGMQRGSDFQNKGSQKKTVITQFEPNRFVAVVSTSRPKMLAFITVPDLGWKAQVSRLDDDGQKTDPVSVKLIRSDDWIPSSRFRYFSLPLLPFDSAGQYEVEFIYSPIEFWIGMWISLAAWIILMAGLVCQCWNKVRITGLK